MQRYSLYLILLVFAITVLEVKAQIKYPGGRIALSFDGNIHDEDDWGASAFSLALIDAANLNDKVVHIDINNHLGQTNESWEEQMRNSIYGAAKRFNFDRELIYDHQSNSDAAVKHLASEINQSGPGKALWIIAAGPMETVWRSLNQANADKRKYVIVVSHSWWNNGHDISDHGGQGQLYNNWSDLKNDFQSQGVSFIKIKDQNRSNGQDDFNTPRDKWSWLKNSENADYRWLYSRDAFSNKFDVSDAGMVYWLLTGATSGGCQDCGWKAAKELLNVSTENDKPEDNTNQSKNFSIPGIVQAEDYASAKGVGTGNLSGGYLGEIDEGDYAEYNVSVQESGTYKLTYKVATNKQGGEIDLLVDGENKVTINIPSTGGSNIWKQYSTELYLSQGSSKVRLSFRGSVNDMFKIDDFSFVLEENSTNDQENQDETNEQYTADYIIPGIVQAEDYASARGLGTGNLSGGYLGEIDEGDYAEYNVSVQESGTYKLTYKVATNKQGGEIDLLVDGENKVTINIPSTGGSNNWKQYSTELYLSQGSSKVRLSFRGSANDMFKIDDFAFKLIEKSDKKEDFTADFVIPGIVQAEDYASAQGVSTGNLSGGYLGNIDGGDYAEYNISVEESGAYKLTYKVATSNQGGDIDLFVGNEFKVTVVISNTGGSYRWKRYSTELELTQGITKLSLRFRGSVDDMFKIDDFSFSKHNANARMSTSTGSKKASSDENVSVVNDIDTKDVVLNLFPNPTSEKLFTNIDDGDYFIYTIDGSLIKSGFIENNGELDISGVEKGTYIIKIHFSTNIKVSKIIID